MTKRAAGATFGLLLAICVGIVDAAARGRYSNFGPWSNDHAQVLPRDVSRGPSQVRPVATKSIRHYRHRTR